MNGIIAVQERAADGRLEFYSTTKTILGMTWHGGLSLSVSLGWTASHHQESNICHPIG